MKTRKVIEMFIDSENEDDWGVHAISVVESPAIEKDFLMFSKDEKEAYQANCIKLMNEEKRIAVGPVLIPEMEIYRNDPKNGEYYIKFSKDTVRKASELYLTRGNQHNVTEEHAQMVEGVSLIESWVTEGAIDKAAHLGFKVPAGTWMGTMKINNDEIWSKVKSGDLKGFSIEGMFTQLSEEPKNDLLSQITNAARQAVYG